MDRNPIIRKWLAIGIILLFIGASVAVTGNSVQKKTKTLHDTPVIELTPSDGLYWNDRKIAEYPVPLFLHYYFKIWATFPIGISIETLEGFERLEIYINEVLQETIEGPGPTYAYSFNVTVTPFHHSLTFGIKVFLYGEEVMSDNVTIYRLLP